MNLKKLAVITLLIIIAVAGIGSAIATVIPDDAAPKVGYLGYMSHCPFAPFSTIISFVIAAAAIIAAKRALGNVRLLNSMSKGKNLLAFVLLAVAFYIPFVIFANVQLFPNFTLINFGAFIPMVTALILVYRENGTGSAVELLKRSFDYKRIKSKIWYLAMLLTIPFTILVQYGLAFLSGSPVSSPYFPVSWPLVTVIVFFAAIGEELGLMGYLFEPIQGRFGALKASILLGVFWASYHIPLFASSGLSNYWIMWQLIYIAATRVLFVWIYSNTGKSIFAVVIMHTLFNSVWLLFPPSGGLARPVFYNPTDLALITIAIDVLAGFLWGSRTLSQFRYGRKQVNLRTL